MKKEEIEKLRSLVSEGRELYSERQNDKKDEFGLQVYLADVIITMAKLVKMNNGRD